MKLFLILVFLIQGGSLWAQCGGDPDQVIHEYSRRFLYQARNILRSRGLVTFLDDSGRSTVVYRVASLASGVHYTTVSGQPVMSTGGFKVTGARFHIDSDMKRSPEERHALELTSENYNFVFEKESADRQNFIYQLIPKDKVVDRFKDNAEIEINRTSCLPISVHGEVFTGHIFAKAYLSVRFGELKGVAMPIFTDVLSRIIGKTYHMTVTTVYTADDLDVRTTP